MPIRSRIGISFGLTCFAIGIILGTTLSHTNIAAAQSSARVFELRTYTTFPGRLDALHERFSQHTMRIFERHNMTNIGYFTPQDSPLAENTLIYVIAHDNREAASQNWKAFIADPEWQRVYEESQQGGRIVENLESVFLDATDYSQLK